MRLISGLLRVSPFRQPAAGSDSRTTRGRRAEIAYLWPHDIGPDRSATFFQRPVGLAEDFAVHLLAGAKSRIAEEVTAKVRLRRAAAIPPMPSRLAFLLFSAWWLGENRARLSAVYTTGAASTFSGWFARRFLGMRWICELWDHPFLDRNCAWQNRRYLAALFYHCRSLLASRMARRADLVVCTGNPGMVRRMRVAPGKLLVSPNGTDSSLFGHPRANNPTPPLQFVYVGWIGRARGAGLMFDAMQLLQAARAPVTLALVGPCIPRDREWVLRRQRSLRGSVSLTGRLAHGEVLRVLARSEIGLYPFPRKEELEFIYPIKVYEYMAMGVVPVCTDLTGVRDIVRDGVEGILLKTGDPEELATRLLHAAHDRVRLEKMRSAARKRAEAFRWDRIHARLNSELASRLGAAASSATFPPRANTPARAANEFDVIPADTSR